MRLFRVLVRLVVWPLMVVAVLYLLLLLVNASDKPPSADAARLDGLFLSRAPVADADNGYLDLLGWQYDPAHPDKEDAVFFEEFKAGCSAIDRPCQDLLLARETAIRKTLAAHGATLARYQGLISRSDWQDPLPINMTAKFPPFTAAVQGQRLLMLDAWMRARSGDAAAVSTALAADHRFWRRVFGRSHALISKMIARVQLGRNLVWGSMVIGQVPGARQDAAVPAQWHMPIAIGERSLLLPLVGEYTFMGENLRDAADGGGKETPALVQVLGQPLLQRQDALNEWASLALAQLRELDVPERDIPAGLARANAIADHASGTWSFADVYNPVGKVLVRMETPKWSVYGARLADVEGIRRAALLTIQLRSAGVEPEQVPARLAASVLRNPYDGKPFGWNRHTRSITFTGLEVGERGRNQFVY
jgi:hypothetical protein